MVLLASVIGTSTTGPAKYFSIINKPEARWMGIVVSQGTLLYSKTSELNKITPQ